MDGMTAARKLRKLDSGIAIVFVTNMAQYAIHGYEVDAIDFIVKPISYYVFKDKLEKSMRSLELNKDKTIIVHDNDSVMKIKVSQILYIEKNKNYDRYRKQIAGGRFFKMHKWLSCKSEICFKNVQRQCMD